jgi:hypothetical protein
MAIDVNNNLKISPADLVMARNNLISLGCEAAAIVYPEAAIATSAVNRIVALSTQNNIYQNIPAGGGLKNRAIAVLTHPVVINALPTLAVLGMNYCNQALGGNPLDENVLAATQTVAMLPNLANIYEVGRRSVKGLADCYRYRAGNGMQALKKGAVHALNLAAGVARPVYNLVSNKLLEQELEQEFRRQFEALPLQCPLIQKESDDFYLQAKAKMQQQFEIEQTKPFDKNPKCYPAPQTPNVNGIGLLLGETYPTPTLHRKDLLLEETYPTPTLHRKDLLLEETYQITRAQCEDYEDPTFYYYITNTALGKGLQSIFGRLES